ncbi:hypothetical protein FA95DRAFT_1606607 [Auriscalpium vulgare]|uniref:Uncharacterized protein n=1 Tax=Auriscalpium vulgare TaxID=40419 RepID=A0ACB8RS59_9AGAM|nr:hypothetical protein FA95DRAFT_1606607 [Auriscalpium vulgare]
MSPRRPSSHPSIPSLPARSYKAGADDRFVGGFCLPVQQSPRRLPPVDRQLFPPLHVPAALSYYQYSQCTGRKKALCIGINYTDCEEPLRLNGCVADAHRMANFLTTRLNYKPEDVLLLTDEHVDSRLRPTKANMLSAMAWLVHGARTNDSLFFHYAGHGNQIRDVDGEEEDGQDETIQPLDFLTHGDIVDDDIHNIMVKPLPPGCRLTSIFDCCHSGTVMDLPYVYSANGKLKKIGLIASTARLVPQMWHGARRGNLASAGTLFSMICTGRHIRAGKMARQTKASAADCISFGACTDSEEAMDLQDDGAMSSAFIASLTLNKEQTFEELLADLRKRLASYRQKPQLSASHPMDVNLQFIA